MKRRAFLQTAGITAIGLTALPRLSRGAPPGEMTVTSTISRNHGHALALTLSQVIEELRATAGGGVSQLDIQGSSGHPHTLELNHEEILALLVDGSLTAPSSQVFGHAHDVQIELAPSP